MVRSRAHRLLAALGLALVAGLAQALVLTASPATAAGPDPRQPQTVSFVSTAPSGPDWFFGDFHGWPGYVAHAESTSGLPVTYSLDPASAGICRLGQVYDHDPILGTGVSVHYDAAGTCTINADQPGDDSYLPAARVSQSFQVARVETWLVAAKATKGVLGLNPSTFSATLRVPSEAGGGGWSTEGYPGQSITFFVAGRPVCTGITDGQGVATCKAAIGLNAWLHETGYTASYAGDANYLGASTAGKLGG